MHKQHVMTTWTVTANGSWKLKVRDTETRWYKYCGVNPIWNKLMWSKMFSLWGSTSCSMYNEWNDNTGDIRQSIPISITSLKYAFGRWFILFCRESFAIRHCANVNRARHIMLFSFNWWPRVEEYWHHTKGLSHYINRLFEVWTRQDSSCKYGTVRRFIVQQVF